ncbi:hypothetical protein F5884DRAFT_672865 [Xylogone sp. PMI_703]|nr:hypothetical protein F5884DRAFT_672865 [Xylogone sp. PMI_703]
MPGKRGRPQAVRLDEYKDEIIQLYRVDGVPVGEIAQRITAKHGVDVSTRTLIRRLGQWSVPNKRVRMEAPEELVERIRFHYNRNLTDKQIEQALVDEGFEIPQNLPRLRQRLGMRRRSRFDQYRDYAPEADPSRLKPSASASPSTAIPRRPVKKPKRKPNPTLIIKVTAFVQKYMSAYDGSHDFNHIRRVVGLAHAIYTAVMEEAERENAPPEFDLDLQVITLASLLHDVGDKKYLRPGEDPNSVVLAKLLELGADEDLAIKVQRIVSGVSYSSEIKDPDAVITMIGKYPELAVVQDADRLDAIGAVGIGRTFAFGGAKDRGMGDTIEHFGDKLVKLEGMMKTRPGKRMAVERTKRLLAFREWWDEELREAEGVLKPSQRESTTAPVENVEDD